MCSSRMAARLAFHRFPSLPQNQGQQGQGSNQLKRGLELALASNPHTDRALDAVVYPDLLEWLVVGCAVLDCVVILSVYPRRYGCRTADGRW
jgi:hypothetical protein